MSDDIVTQLRNIANLRGDLGGHVIPLACLNAADEIERLRTLGDALAATGGQHGFDEALDNWKEMRGD